MLPFVPLFRNNHLQTILGHYWPRPHSPLPIERKLYTTEPGVQVSVWSQVPAEPVRGEIVMVHGLEGSGEAGYMQSLSAAATAAGFAAHRFHMRTCGGTEHLCQTLYHAGLTSDLLAVLREFRASRRAPVFLVGYSLGGNVVLKLAGELRESARELIRGVCAISTPIDLAACARRIAEPDNRIYQRRFVSRMRQRLSATGRYKAAEFAKLDSVYAIDDHITAPSFGFGTADNYYATQSSIRFLDGIRVPAVLIQAKDDTFIPFEMYGRPEVGLNPLVELVATEYGGHVGFIGRSPRLWLDAAIVDWIEARLICRPDERP